MLFWIGAVLLVSLISFVVDRTTGDETGPPYHDPLINRVALFVFMATIPVLVVLVGVALVRFSRRSSA